MKKTSVILKTAAAVFFLIIGSLHAQRNNLSEINDLLIKEDYFRAVPLLEAAAGRDSTNFAILQKLGISYQKTYRYDKALKVFNRLSSLNSGNKDILLSLGYCYQESGDQKKAEDIFRQVFSEDTLNFRAGINLAELLFRKPDVKSAAQVYQTLLRADSTSPHLLRLLGTCYMQLDSLELSNCCFSAALALNPNDMTSLQMLAGNYIKMQLPQKAQKLIESYRSELCKNPVLSRLYGDIYFNMKNYTEAQRGYYISRDQGDTTAYVFQKIGISNYLFGNSVDANETRRKELCYKLAKAALEKSYFKDSNPITAYFLALSNQKLGYYEIAVDLLKTSINIIQPDILHDIYLRLGENLLSLKNYEQVAYTYETALHLKPGSTELLLKTASLYDEFLHDAPNALRLYREYIKQPDAEKNKTEEVNKRIIQLTGAANK